MDIRYIYLLRMKRGKISCVHAVKVPFAGKREKRLHDMFDCSRFTMTRNKRNGHKIGIAKNLPRRMGTIRADKLSGKTEWFHLTWLEVLAVRYWLVKWSVGWFWFQFVVFTILGAIVIWWLTK